MIVTAASYNGRLHLGYGDENTVGKCLGESINTYRNFISKFFTRILGFSIDVYVDGKVRCLNKKSLLKHFHSIGLENVTIDEVRKIGYNALVIKNSSQIITQNDKLGESFSNTQRMKYFTKMVSQLEVNNTQAVKRLICKGAYVDREFFKPEKKPIDGKSFWRSRPVIEKVLSYNYYETNFYSYTPLALASEKRNQSLAKFILNAKNGDISSDKKTTNHLIGKGYGSWYTHTIKIEQLSVDNEGNVHIA